VGLAPLGVQRRPERHELLLREPAPGAAAVDERALLEGRQVQGAEAGARALRLREADDHEVVRALVRSLSHRGERPAR